MGWPSGPAKGQPGPAEGLIVKLRMWLLPGIPLKTAGVGLKSPAPAFKPRRC